MPFFTASQLVAHLVGDYLLQSHWMATEETRSMTAAMLHSIAYTTPFWFITTDWRALVMIQVGHFVLDHWRLARYVVWLENGFPDSVPPWLAVWLLIIVDNLIHLIWNATAIAVFG